MGRCKGFQDGRKSSQHQKSIKASATTSMVSKIRWGISEILFVVGDGDETVRGALTEAVEVRTEVGSCSLFQAGCDPLTSVGVELLCPVPLP